MTDVRTSQPPVLEEAVTTDVPVLEEVLVEESLVEEVSIDGMCGVY